MSKKHIDYSRKLKQLCVFAMFGVIMFISKKIMEFLPNFHLVGMLVITLTAVYRVKALIPIYIYVMLDGLFGGFNLWWYPYLYLWAVLWGMTMIVPKRIPRKFSLIVYPSLCAFHGLIFGSLYAPFQALVYDFTFKQTIEWILLGFTFDVVHMIGNLCVGILIVPCIEIIRRLEKTY